MTRSWEMTPLIGRFLLLRNVNGHRPAISKSSYHPVPPLTQLLLLLPKPAFLGSERRLLLHNVRRRRASVANTPTSHLTSCQPDSIASMADDGAELDSSVVQLMASDGVRSSAEIPFLEGPDLQIPLLVNKMQARRLLQKISYYQNVRDATPAEARALSQPGPRDSASPDVRAATLSFARAATLSALSLRPLLMKDLQALPARALCFLSAMSLLKVLGQRFRNLVKYEMAEMKLKPRMMMPVMTLLLVAT
eukprot:IDg23521t1